MNYTKVKVVVVVVVDDVIELSTILIIDNLDRYLKKKKIVI
jgi:hypothetical protein